MIQFDNSNIASLAVHYVGNKTLDEGIELSECLVLIDDEDFLNITKRYFLSSFSGNEMYNFHNDVGLEQNEIFTISNRIFDNPDTFFNQTKLIAQHLYNSSTHPKIKSGELYVAYLENIFVNGVLMNALGIFKAENKEDYIKTDLKNKNRILYYDEGTSIKNLDKGCLVFNTHKEKGYDVCIIDNLNKSNEAIYWKDDFLGVQPLRNEFHQTNQFLGITKQFVTKQIVNDIEISRADQIDMLNRSVEYFKTHELFDKSDFESKVFQDEGIINSFRNFDNSYREENKVELLDSFEISPQAVKKQARVFKSVLKLDKNFHIYIHGNRDLIEQGVDENGRKYYKIYYQEES